MKNQFSDYTVIQGNAIYSIKNAEYTYNDGYNIRTFRNEKNELIFSIPAFSSVLIKNGEGVSVQIKDNLNTGTASEPQTATSNQPSVVRKTKYVAVDDSYGDGLVTGAIVGALLF